MVQSSGKSQERGLSSEHHLQYGWEQFTIGDGKGITILARLGYISWYPHDSH